jgi:Holliday junction resolvase
MAQSNKRKGTDRENKVKALLQSEGYIVCRAAASIGSADLVALKHGERPKFIQVKCTKSQYAGFGPEEREQLLKDCLQAGANAYLYWWPTDRKGLRIIEPTEWPGYNELIWRLMHQIPHRIAVERLMDGLDLEMSLIETILEITEEENE